MPEELYNRLTQHDRAQRAAFAARARAVTDVATKPMVSLVAHGVPRDLLLNLVAAVAARAAGVEARDVFDELSGDLVDYVDTHEAEPPVAFFFWNDFDRMAEHVQAHAGGELASVSASEFYLGGARFTRADVDALVGRVLEKASFEPKNGNVVVLDNRMVVEVVGALARKYHVRRSEEPGGDATPRRSTKTLELAASAGPAAARPPLLAGPGRPSGFPAIEPEDERLFDEELIVSKGLRQLKSEIRTALGRDAKSPDDGELWKRIKAWALSRGAREEDLNMDAKLDTPRRRYVVGIVLRKLPYQHRATRSLSHESAQSHVSPKAICLNLLVCDALKLVS
jgi:hypothetical protein